MIADGTWAFERNLAMQQTATRHDFPPLRGAVQRTVIHLWEQHGSSFSTGECWSPAVNIYSSNNALRICVDLAGLDPAKVDVRVEAGRLTLRGRRPAPEPVMADDPAAGTLRILAMEIDHGPFSREIALPPDVDLTRVSSTYDNGLLWIHLPRRAPA